MQVGSWCTLTQVAKEAAFTRLAVSTVVIETTQATGVKTVEVFFRHINF
jgi:hypothetical protein